MELILIMVFWTVVCILAAVYAGKLGRRKIGWFCFAFFVPFGGLLVWPILLLIGSPKSGHIQKIEDEVRIMEAKIKLSQLKKDHPDLNDCLDPEWANAQRQ